MKKAIICAALALMVVLSMTGAVAGAYTPEQTTPVEYVVSDSYSWSAPAELIVGTTPDAANFGVPNNGTFNIDHSKKLTITVESDQNWAVVNGAYSQASYDLYIATNKVNTDNPATLLELAGSATPTGLVILEAKWRTSQPTVAGDYIDDLTFTAAIS